MWIICIGCHHIAEIKPLRKDRRLKCSACGSRVARVVRRVKTSMMNGGQVEPDKARVLTYAGLLSIVRARGYKPGWAAMKFKIIYGKWPEGEAPAPMDPSGELMWWVRREGIAYAKARREREGIAKRPEAAYRSSLMTAADWEEML